MNLHLHFCKEKLDLLPDCNFSSHAIFHICYILKSINVKCMFTNQFLENFFTINWITCIRWAKNNLCDFKLYAPVPAFRKPFICVFTTNCVYTCTLTSSRLFSFFLIVSTTVKVVLFSDVCFHVLGTMHLKNWWVYKNAPIRISFANRKCNKHRLESVVTQRNAGLAVVYTFMRDLR